MEKNVIIALNRELDEKCVNRNCITDFNGQLDNMSKLKMSVEGREIHKLILILAKERKNCENILLLTY